MAVSSFPRDLDTYAYANGVTSVFSLPSTPTGNGFIEVFNSKIREEMSEESLVHEPCRRTRKAGGLSQTLK